MELDFICRGLIGSKHVGLWYYQVVSESYYIGILLYYYNYFYRTFKNNRNWTKCFSGKISKNKYRWEFLPTLEQIVSLSGNRQLDRLHLQLRVCVHMIYGALKVKAHVHFLTCSWVRRRAGGWRLYILQLFGGVEGRAEEGLAHKRYSQEVKCRERETYSWSLHWSGAALERDLLEEWQNKTLNVRRENPQWF